MTTKRKWTLVSAAIVLAALVAWCLVPPSERPFLDYLAERRAAGMPTTFDELTGPAPPESENGAAEIDAAMRTLITRHGPTSSWAGSAFDPNMPMTEGQDGPTQEQLAPLTPIVAKMRPELDRVAAAVERPRLHFAAVLDADGNLDDARVRLLQEAVRVLSMPATAEDDPARRLAACRSLLLLGRRFDIAGITDGMVAVVCRAAGVAALRRGLRAGKIDPAAARASCDELLRVPTTDVLRRALHAAPVELIERYQAMLDGRVVPTWSRPNVTASQRTQHALKRLSDVFKGDAPELELLTDLAPGKAKLVVRLCRAWDGIADDDPRRALVSGDAARSDVRILAPKLFFSALRQDAQARLARVGLAAAEFRAARGDWPASLDELRPMFPDGVPIDPFTEKPFEYERTKTLMRLSSVGRTPEGFPISDAERVDSGLLWELPR